MTFVNPEIRNRIRLSVAAYAYEVRNDPIMTDAEFDILSTKIAPGVPTGDVKFDRFFSTYFTPHSGMWIHRHPDKAGLERVYKMLTRSYDELHNDDLFGPEKKEPVQVIEPVPRHMQCRRCKRDITKFPADGGCYC